MRFNFPSLFLSSAAATAVLAVGLCGNSLQAQDQSQPAVGIAPPATAATTQAPKTPDPNRQAKMMTKRLGLSADQSAKIEPILAQRDQQVESTRADSTLAPKEQRAKIRGIRQDSDSQIEALLTDTQKQQYEQMKQQRAHGHKGAQQPVGPATAQ